MNFILRLLVTAAVAFLLSKVLSGVQIRDIETALVFAFVLALLNLIVKPILVFFTFPITIITLGLFLFVINALIILLADKMINGINVDGFISAVIFSLLLSVITSILNGLLEKK